MVAAVIGLAVTVVMFVGAPGVPASGRATLGGVSLEIERAAWMDSEELHSGGMAMPSSMMPGMPAEGTHRLQLELMLRNAGSRAERLEHAGFVVRAEDGRTWPPRVERVARSTLAPGQTIELEVSYDVTEGASGLALAWRRGGRTVRIPLADGDHHETGQRGRAR